MRLHVYAAAAEAYAFRFQAQALFDRGIAGQFDRAACSQDTLPRQSESAPENGCHLPRRSGKSRRLGDTAIGRYFATRNCANRLLDTQTHLSRSVRIDLLGARSAACWPHSPIDSAMK
jgi:hypothetical protein